MKKITKALFAVMLLGLAAGARAEDKYDQLAKELTEAGSSIQGKKIAIIPFSYADAREKASKDGSVIAERLTIKMINMHKFEIIERSVLDKVMNELKLQSSGMIDASSAQQLGKVLGVEAIVTGTLVETSGGQIEVNARMIKTETAQAIGASQVTVEKNWIGDVSSAPQGQSQTYQQPAYQQTSYDQPAPKQVYRRPRGEYEYGYFDLFMGFGSPNMALEFSNSNSNIYLSALGITAAYNGPYNSVKWDKIQMEGFGPIAMRVGGYGNGNVGGAFELGIEKRNIKPQNTTWTLNNSGTGNFTFTTNDYLTLTSFQMGGDLMVRFTKKTKVEPYLGLGIGLSLNSINMPRVKGYTNSATFSAPTDEFAVGFMFNMPFGARIRIGEKTQLVTELRYQLNTMTFDRGVTGEQDRLTLSGMYFNLGIGFNF